MQHLAIIRRHLAILRLVQPPFQYPPKEKLLERLQEETQDPVSKRTFERDIKGISDCYGIKVAHCPRRKGYYLDQPADEDLSNFRQFFQLLERTERLAFLTNSSDALRTSQYLMLEENQSSEQLQHLPVLWEALRTQRQLAFQYQTFHADLPKAYQLDPLLLLEYRNRWYLAAWDGEDERFKTFGLERMQSPCLTDATVSQDRRAEFMAMKQDGLGVTISPEQEVTTIILQVDAVMTPYIKTVSIHSSQKLLQQDGSGMSISLQMVINLELESAILGFGEHVQVLAPPALRDKIKQRVQKMTNKYKSIVDGL